MELRYVLLTIIKIIISIPTIVLNEAFLVEAATLMGGHLDNINNQPNNTEFGLSKIIANSTIHGNSNPTSEEIPDPSPLVVPGYNLPENIFNKGKPFYLEKDPLTGKIDFDSKSTSLDDDLYDYVEEVPSNSDIFNKANIDRKDGPLEGHHQQSDINQLTPNFHDFLNLPVKYNPDKYVYPLISSSYANTKIQGNVNKYHNHKDYRVKTSTAKPTASPTYYTTNFYHQKPKTEKTTTTTSTTTTTQKSTTQVVYPHENLMNSGINHPSFHEDFDDYYEESTEKVRPTEVFLTTKNVDKIYLTTKAPPSTTTKRALSMFEQLFGEYEDYGTSTERVAPPVFQNFPTTIKKIAKTTTTTRAPIINSHSGPTSTGLESSYEYEEYPEDNIAVESHLVANVTSVTTTTTTSPITSEVPDSTPKVTSLPLGENHINVNNQQSIIVATNLREQLSHEKVVPKPFAPQPPSTSNIHIAPDQDTVSFVVGNHQNVEGTGQYQTSQKEPPYAGSPFRPLFGQQAQYSPDSVSYSVHAVPVASSVTIQPQKKTEASLAIGVPIKVPGQVVDEKLDLEEEKVDFPKGNGPKIVFPDDKPQITKLVAPPNREVLHLNSKPMYHQLPSDLTPPREKDSSAMVRPRPPWDPRPGHFYSGKPEYVRPPRPEQAYKRIDNLPNILPQFRPNVPHNNVPPPYLNRQPLLDRPSNRPVGFFEKLQPPPPPKNLHHLRKIPPPPNHIQESMKPGNDQFGFFQAPPKPMIANRRIADVEDSIETLQMIQAKKVDKVEIAMEKNETTDKPLYVVYPVNTPPLKMDESNKDSVVIGTRAELPLPPSKINKFDYEQNPILNPKDRNDAPILKPHPRPSYPIKSDFPYPLERPDPTHLNPVLDTPTNHNKLEDDIFISNNQWNTIGENLEPRIVNAGKGTNQISVTLKTYPEKPIAVAYTPTEPNKYEDRYSMPNYASPVIPEIRPGTVDNVDPASLKADNEFTVSAVMHTHPQFDMKHKNKFVEEGQMSQNHRIDTDTVANVPQLEFQAPFQASVNLDSISQGWSVVRDRSKSTTEIGEEVTTLPLATTSEFDIENFKPELIGGFKPIYSLPEDEEKKSEVSERQE